MCKKLEKKLRQKFPRRIKVQNPFIKVRRHELTQGGQKEPPIKIFPIIQITEKVDVPFIQNMQEA